ncbi:MAG TPA: hypothetical protein VFF39_06965, partial [Verrucomicrobiae bacterium]|nr:hypothetical protein [Verrucomicrobiae bacterium]
KEQFINKKNLLLGSAALLLVATLVVFSQTSSQFPELDKNGKPLLPRPMPHLVYSPADLAHSGVVLPATAGSPTPNTAIIRVGDATKMTVFASCTQNFDLVMNVYTADDQGQSSPNFTFYNSYVIATNMSSGGQQAYSSGNRSLRENASFLELAQTVQSTGGSVNGKLPKIYAKVKS